MHREPGDALFSGAGRGPLVRALALAAALTLNAGLRDTRALAVLGAVGLAALLVEGRRLAPVLLALAAAGQGLLVACLLALRGASPDDGLLVLARAGAGAVWCAHFAATVGWADLLAALRRAGAPPGLLDAVDLALAQALVLGEELRRRAEVATLRQGFARGQPRVETCGLVLAGGIDRALDRGARLDEARTLRAAAVPPAPAAGDASPALRARGLVVRHRDGTPGLAGVDLEVPRGAWVALAGASGSGKTTLLRALAGLLPAAEGRLERLGAPLDARALAGRVDPRVAVVFQEPDEQLLGATPRDDVLWGLRRRGLDEEAACARATRALEALGVGHLAERPVHRLSLGERKRVAFAAALATEPEVLLCDEPTSGLDPAARRALCAALEAAARARALTVVWATHDLDALPAGVDRVVLLRGGRVVFDGPRAAGLSPDALRAAALVPDPEAP
ncbi:MAG: energy-coupling factor ABC transporter ATP-binding protein [Planctomycetes bacterium]|nr:energy-coupling factor ABC transporter ATP-binding protein [Planctomycetota bacterium]